MVVILILITTFATEFRLKNRTINHKDNEKVFVDNTDALLRIHLC